MREHRINVVEIPDKTNGRTLFQALKSCTSMKVILKKSKTITIGGVIQSKNIIKENKLLLEILKKGIRQKEI